MEHPVRSNRAFLHTCPGLGDEVVPGALEGDGVRVTEEAAPHVNSQGRDNPGPSIYIPASVSLWTGQESGEMIRERTRMIPIIGLKVFFGQFYRNKMNSSLM